MLNFIQMEILKSKEFWYFFIPFVTGILIYYMGQSIRVERKHLLVLFKANQTLSKRIQEKLKLFIDTYGATNVIALPERNVTYGTWYELMVSEYDTYLSDVQYQQVKSTKISKPTLLSMTDSLNKQNEALRIIELDLNLVIKKVSEGRI